MPTLRHYCTETGRTPFLEWFDRLQDRQAKTRILIRLERLELGKFGDTRYLKGGVSELRVDWGPGYRIYFARDGEDIVLLLCGGDKRRQHADIERACALWQAYERRKRPDAKPLH